ncbi:hypothetical protein AAFF_G00168910 [Aldrovandia affinis]|uniref:Uncharacterized protein n=1 Tax=Aldrovandia affinis TaxID=143900 RepID=A0AAD7W7T8_9TELE|nr:hypothetical protein AAFF_G00168910 [Aldrovandia affinis]
MPFSILMVQSQRWHISECLDMLGEDRQECPDAFKCSSTIPSHYKKYSHFLLAHSRATNEKASLSPNSSQESVTNVSTPSSQSPSPSPGQGGPGQKPTPMRPNAFLLLKSPAPGDIRKKKGWSPVAKVRKTVSAGQGGGATRPSAKASRASGTLREHPTKADLSSASPSPSPSPSAVPVSPASPSNSDKISYSPLSAPPAGSETPPSRRSLSYSVMAGGKEEEEEGDSVMLYSDDELFAELLTQAEIEGNNQPGNGTVVVNSSEAPETPFTSLVPSGDELNEDSTIITSSVPPGDELNEDSAGVACSPVPVCPLRGLKGQHVAAARTDDGRLQLQSPQSLVLEQLRERLCTSVDPGSGDAPAGGVKQEDVVSDPSPSATQSSTHEAPASMAPRKARDKAAKSSGLKQTDIGVFFGLKPLRPEGGGTSAKENLPQAFPVAGGDAGVQGNGRRKRKATGSASEPKVLGGVEGCANQTQPAGRGRGRGEGERERERERGGRAGGGGRRRARSYPDTVPFTKRFQVHPLLWMLSSTEQ